LPVVVGTRASPYGLTSPLAGTVDAISETVFAGARNAAVVAVAVVAGALAEVELDVLLPLDPPHPASTMVASGTPKINLLCIGLLLCFREHAERNSSKPRVHPPTSRHDPETDALLPGGVAPAVREDFRARSRGRRQVHAATHLKGTRRPGVLVGTAGPTCASTVPDSSQE
jgi:hypothetical protein